MSEDQMCSRCLLDTTVSSIRFDENGVCQFCKSHERLAELYPQDETQAERRSALISKIKQDGRGKNYDCVVGVSGGTDSTYTLHQAKAEGLRPLAVHFDNGWNTNEAVTNIKNICSALDVDLFTYVVNWEEFKDLEISFLKASVPCVEAPTDVGIHGALMQTASQEKLRFILGGQSFITEGTVPREWSYLDGAYIKSVQKQFGQVRLRSFPNLSLTSIAYYTFLRGIRQVPFLNYYPYRKDEAKELLAETYGWRDYGGHHYENTYSRFAFGWYLPRKFNIDKRRVSLSGPVRAGLLSKEDALKSLAQKPDVPEELVEYTWKKLGLQKSEFEDLMQQAPKTYRDYYTSENLLRLFRYPIKMAAKMRIITPVLYEKYLG